MLLSGSIWSLPGFLNNPALCSSSALAKDQQTKSGFVLLNFFCSNHPAEFCLPHRSISGFPNCDFGELQWNRELALGFSHSLTSSLRARGIYFCPVQSKVGRGRRSQWAFHVVLGMCQHCKAHFSIQFFMCS